MSILVIIAVSAIAAFAVMIAVFICAWKFPESISGHFIWGVAMLLGVCSCILLGMRGVAPDLLSIVLANILFCSMLALMIAAISQFYEQPIPWKLSWFWVFFISVALIYSGATEQGLHVRAQVLSWPKGILFVTAGWIIIKNISVSEFHVGATAVMLSFIVAGLVTISRAITYFGWGGGYEGMLTESVIQRAYIMSQGGGLLIASIGFIVMGYEKLAETQAAREST